MPAVPQIYRTQAARPGRSLFNLSYDLKTTCDMSMIIPIMAKEAIPGDVWSISVATQIRLMPLVAPVLHRINARFDYFFIPYRLLWDGADPDNFEYFITGGEDGDYAAGTPTFPTWNPTSRGYKSLWSYLGFPVSIDPTDRRPSILPCKGYNLVYNEYYRRQEIQSEVSLTQEAILDANWRLDYFTSALLDQQRGTAPAFPVTGSATWALSTQSGAQSSYNFDNVESLPWNAGDQTALNNNTLSTTTFDISAVRLALAQQRHLEINNRVGARYTEYLLGHYGVTIDDLRLQRPHWIGSATFPIITTDVLNTSATATEPQASYAASGQVRNAGRIGTFRCKEWGFILGNLIIRPEASYQEGVDREWIKSTRYDFYSPEFAGLSDQIIEEVELKASATGANNTTVFGYAGAWDHYRISHSKITGLMRKGATPDFTYWHLGREFSSRPALNTAFITAYGEYADAPEMKRIFAVEDEQSFMVEVGNILKASRPLPFLARPGGLG